jgi:N-(2-amino-2-carboxyethyl)-L-glutamate synthase
MILDRPIDFDFTPIFARVSGLFQNKTDVLLKLEGFNPGGSIKFKPALALIAELERRNALSPGSILIDTTSGNMGVALAVIARSLSYGFICVSDEKMTAHNRRLVQAYGGVVVILEHTTLQQRYDYIQDKIAHDPRLVWTRQFQNAENPAAHEVTTAREILGALPRVDHLFIGVGTGGTIAGCSKVFASESPWTRITAVDAEGSRHFDSGSMQTARTIPGIGATQRSPFLDAATIHRVVIVPEHAAISSCRLLSQRTGWLLGGSSGSVLSAMLSSQAEFSEGETVVGVCADFGERYLDSVYAEETLPALELAGQAS